MNVFFAGNVIGTYTTTTDLQYGSNFIVLHTCGKNLFKTISQLVRMTKQGSLFSKSPKIGQHALFGNRLRRFLKRFIAQHHRLHTLRGTDVALFDRPGRQTGHNAGRY